MNAYQSLQTLMNATIEEVDVSMIVGIPLEDTNVCVRQGTACERTGEAVKVRPLTLNPWPNAGVCLLSISTFNCHQKGTNILLDEK